MSTTNSCKSMDGVKKTSTKHRERKKKKKTFVVRVMSDEFNQR